MITSYLFLNTCRYRPKCLFSNQIGTLPLYLHIKYISLNLSDSSIRLSFIMYCVSFSKTQHKMILLYFSWSSGLASLSNLPVQCISLLSTKNWSVILLLDLTFLDVYSELRNTSFLLSSVTLTTLYSGAILYMIEAMYNSVSIGSKPDPCLIPVEKSIGSSSNLLNRNYVYLSFR